MKKQRKISEVIFFILVAFLLYNSKVIVANAVSNNAISVSDNEIATDIDKVSESKDSDSTLVQIEVPSNISFILDPFELNSKGQIYSSVFDIVNKSDVDVEIEISDIKYIFSDGSECVASAAPIASSTDSDKKDIYLFLNWVDDVQADMRESTSSVGVSHTAEDLDVVITAEEKVSPRTFFLKAATYNSKNIQIISPASRISFCLDGSINSNPSIPWEKGDVKIELSYVCKAIENSGEATKSVSDNELSGGSISDNSISDNSILDNNDIQTENQPASSISENAAMVIPEINSDDNPIPQPNAIMPSAKEDEKSITEKLNENTVSGM